MRTYARAHLHACRHIYAYTCTYHRTNTCAHLPIPMNDCAVITISRVQSLRVVLSAYGIPQLGQLCQLNRLNMNYLVWHIGAPFLRLKCTISRFLSLEHTGQQFVVVSSENLFKLSQQVALKHLFARKKRNRGYGGIVYTYKRLFDCLQ